MTKEELEKEAIKASDKKCVKGCSKYYRYGFQDGYITGVEPREKRIAELEAQIEKMKSAVISERDEALRVEDIITYGVLNDIIDKWEIKEKMAIQTVNLNIQEDVLSLRIENKALREVIIDLEAQIEKMKLALIDIKSNTDDVNIEWQIKYLFDELEIKEK